MKFIFIFIISFSVLNSKGQITQINTGTNASLWYLSVLDNNVLVCGTSTYISKSYDQCENLTPLSCPGNSINSNIYQRVDTNNIFMVSNGNGATLFRSYDGGSNWINKWSSSYGSGCFAFFDTLQGIVASGFGNTLYYTLNGGSTWTNTTLPIGSTDVVSLIKRLNDTTAVFSTYGDFYFSTNRGQNWSYGYSFGQAQAADFFYLNNDTIFGVSGPNQLMGNSIFSRTYNGGSWQNLPAPLLSNKMICFRRPNELYVIGADQPGNGGIIAKSTDFGQSWTKFNTGVVCTLLNLAFLNDSVALLSGTGGALLKWNYKHAIFTGLAEQGLQESDIQLFPNPCQDAITIAVKQYFVDVSLNIHDVYGRLLYSDQKVSNNEHLSLEFLKPGVYFFDLSIGREQKKIKVIKE